MFSRKLHMILSKCQQWSLWDKYRWSELWCHGSFKSYMIFVKVFLCVDVLGCISSWYTWLPRLVDMQMLGTCCMLRKFTSHRSHSKIISEKRCHTFLWYHSLWSSVGSYLFTRSALVQLLPILIQLIFKNLEQVYTIVCHPGGQTSTEFSMQEQMFIGSY